MCKVYTQSPCLKLLSFENNYLCSLNLQEINYGLVFFPPEATVHNPKFSSPGKDSLQEGEKILLEDIEVEKV